MTEREITDGIKLLCETSIEVEGFYQSDQNIIEALNNANIEDLNRCAEYYSGRKGVVIDIRKELINRLIQKEIFTVKSLHELINKYKKGKEKQFRSYKETYSIIFPAITFYGHNIQRNFVESFTKKLIKDLSIGDSVKEVSFDFQGVRQQGSDRYWVAIYNKEQENQSKGIQFFFEFYKGKIGYGVYRHESKSYLKPRETPTPEKFNYMSMLSYFDGSKEILLEDIPQQKDLLAIPANAKVIYAYLKKSLSHRKIQSEILGEEAPARGGGFLAMEILHSYEIERDKKGILKKTLFNREYNKAEGKYFEALDLLKKHYPEFTANNVKNDKPYSMAHELNQILYGPPGTGKTYNTINKALELCGDDISSLKRLEIKKLYNKRVNEGRIVFTTFHQSMTYEDFIEGIKPESKDDILSYAIEDGIFKQLCYTALFAHFSKNNDVVTEFTEFDNLYEKYIEYVENRLDKLKDDKKLLLPLKSKGYFTEIKSINEEENYLLTRGTRANSDAKIFKERLRLLYNKFKSIDDIKDVSTDIRSVGKGLGWSSNYYGVFKDFKKFEKSKTIKSASKSTSLITYKDYEKIKNLISNSNLPENYNDHADNFVLIIDEINRGNISQIFGELITLLEADKRLGNPEELQLTLPYSKTTFGVPPNLFVLGTMNTADRSVEALDTALRRRFSFTEMPPKPKLIKSEGKVKNGIINGIHLSQLLDVINMRIEKLLDKDHMIGHSYFLSVDSLYGLKAAFQNRIIPLLQEYFFGDYGKIGLVIGSVFFDIKENQVEEDFFAQFEDYDSSPFLERKVYHLKNVQDMNDETFIQGIEMLTGKKM